ncbi:ankyrin repeat-containing domain protein [Baffinella frigidus]|nr:ankyrin repeat-containing domain protein [Cryptophyta sp. CCMP2293]
MSSAPTRQVGPNDVSTLFEAAEMGNDEIAKMLLDKGALVDRRAPEGGETALSMACHMGRGTVVKTLLDFHADVNHRMVSDQFDTPLMLAVMSKSGTARIEEVRTLLERHLLMTDPVVRTLLERGASVNLRRRDGRTAMDLARGTQGDAKVELLEMLVAAGGMGQFELPAGSLPPTSGE